MMNKELFRKILASICVTILVAILILIIYVLFFPSGRAMFNQYTHTMKQTDNRTLYQTRKDVEDTCRSMQASYESDKLVWLQFKDSDVQEKRNWADAAMIRANKTAAEYNNYILKNKYVWKENVPADIYITMDYLGVEPE